MKHCNWKTIYLLNYQDFTVYKMIVNNKKILIVGFFLPKTSLDAHTVHGLSFHLRTPLIIKKVCALQVQICLKQLSMVMQKSSNFNFLQDCEINCTIIYLNPTNLCFTLVGSFLWDRLRPAVPPPGRCFSCCR